MSTKLKHLRKLLPSKSAKTRLSREEDDPPLSSLQLELDQPDPGSWDLITKAKWETLIQHAERFLRQHDALLTDEMEAALRERNYPKVIALLKVTGLLGEIKHGSHDDPFNDQLTRVGLWLAAHKYFEVDRRRGDPLSWKYDQRVFFKHFPLPRLKRLHPSVVTACERGVPSCVAYIDEIVRRSNSFTPRMSSQNETDFLPFSSAIDMFRFRTTAAYFLCWFTMKRDEALRNFSPGSSCLEGLDYLREKHWADVDVTDFRTNSPENPLQCAEILFCPDPCYGRQSEGTVAEGRAGQPASDQGNPCQDLKDPSCRWAYSKNLDFNSLQRNRFNVSCNCKGEEAVQPGFEKLSALGFEWNSKFGLCVDIDECMRNKTLCDHGKVCQNLKGSYHCVCPRGDRYDVTLGRCVEHVPLPAYSFSRPARVKPKKHLTKLMRHLWHLLGLSPPPDP